jgi:hypothetical protein
VELERLSLELRRRSPWEAADLGLPVLRRWRGAVYRAWFATFVPFALFLFLAFWQWPALAAFIAWWCKPLFDRVLLRIYSEAVFDEPPSVREVWRALPGLVRNSGLLWGLTLGRVDMARSFHLPIRQLEGQQGHAAKARRRVLDRKAHACAVWLTFLCAHFSAFLQISLLLLLDFFWPQEAPPVFDWEAWFHGETGFWLSFLPYLAWIFGETLIEPFYVAAGFTLYLNRRNDLEGWDIELGFRRLTRRVEAERRAAVLAGLGLAGFLLWQLPSDGFAEPSPSERAEQTFVDSPHPSPLPEGEGTGKPPLPERGGAGKLPLPERGGAGKLPLPERGGTGKLPLPERGGTGKLPLPLGEGRGEGIAKRAIQAVLDDPVFGREVPDWDWRYRGDEKKDDKPAPEFETIAKWLVDWIAKGIRMLSYAGAAVLAAVLIVLLYRYRDAWRSRPTAARTIPATLFGLDVRPDSLPADVAGAAGRLLAAGEFAAALSLLYRGALVSLIHVAQVDFRPGDTEGDCRGRVRGRIDADAENYFAELLDAWILTAYAHAAPPAEKLRDLCARWPRHFAAVDRPVS